MTCPAPPRVLHGEMYSLRIFVLIFDAIDAFSFAVLKTPFLLSRIRSLTPLRLKESASDTSCDAMAGGSHTQQAQHPQRALPSKALRSSRQEPPPRPLLSRREDAATGTAAARAPRALRLGSGEGGPRAARRFLNANRAAAARPSPRPAKWRPPPPPTGTGTGRPTAAAPPAAGARPRSA